MNTLRVDLALFALRLTFGGMMLGSHGFGKLLGYSENHASFPDPIGLGSSVSLALVVFAEFFCSAAIVVGLFTRLAVIPLTITMCVAAGIFHAGDPWAKKEFALLYAFAFLAIGIAGAGRLSADHIFRLRLR